MSFIRKTALFVSLLLLLSCCALPEHGYTMTATETMESITIPTEQWNSLKTELTALNSELTEYKKEIQLLKKPSAELVQQLQQAEKTLSQLQTALEEQKSDLTMLSKEAEESKTLLATLKQHLTKERKIHKRQVWQNRIWCIIIGAGIGYAASR